MKRFNLVKLASSLVLALMATVFIVSCGGGDGGDGGPVPPATTPVGTAARLVTITTSMPTPTTGVSISAGTASGKLAINMDTGAIGGSILYSGLSTTTIGGSIRRSSDNAVIVPLSNPTGTTTGAWAIPAGTVLDPFQISELVNGGFRFRLDTTANNQGDKRGDITFPSITITTPMPPVAGTGSAGGGTGTLTANLGTGAISGSVTFSGLTSNAVAGHIHQSSDNAVIITLEGGAGTQAGTFTVPAGAFLNTQQLKALVNNGLYFAIHSQNFQAPVSELLGNIVYPVTTIPSVSLGGSQEVPSVTTVGSGTGTLTVSLGTGKVSGSVSFNTPGSIADRAHIHQGFAGENGSIIITLEGGAPSTSGTWNVPANRFLNADELGALISDGLYLNIHTASNPNGEIRGQIVNVPTN
jgi:hypothetical protein